jgi:tRNA(Arg) A34 adenosine deaminase TadA
MKAPQYTLEACIDYEELHKRTCLEPERQLDAWVVQAVPRFAEQLLRYLSGAVPLGRSFAHLKRGHRDSAGAVHVLLALADATNGVGDTPEAAAVLSSLGVPLEWVQPLTLQRCSVPAVAPRTGLQSQHWSRTLWPVIYRPEAPDPPQLDEGQARTALVLLEQLERQLTCSESNAAMLVRWTELPASAQVICTARGPHAPLQCIDEASRIFRVREGGHDHPHYMLTGLDLLTVVEPCVCCAMAATHSRIRRLFFIQSDRHFGGILRVGVHRLKALNHRYEAYQRRVCGKHP